MSGIFSSFSGRSSGGFSVADDLRFIDFQEYRCAIVADKIYQPADLSGIGLPTASAEQIQNIFGTSQIAFRESDDIRSQLYHDLHSDKFILCFGGTVPRSVNDWRNNFNQFLGKRAEQYVNGIELVNKIRDDYVDRVIVTGHSLGGGIATVAAIARKLKCFVFNPPAIHPNTFKNFEPFDRQEINERITRFVVAGEFLDLVNKVISLKHKRIGTKQQLYGSFRIPNLIGLFFGRRLIAKIIPNPAILLISTIGLPLLEKSLALHSMEEVLCGLKKYLYRSK